MIELNVLGQVYYLTYNLIFPHDKAQWIRQEPFTGRAEDFLARSDLPPDHKTRLIKQGETSWKDHNGVWIILKLETERRASNWGSMHSPKQRN